MAISEFKSSTKAIRTPSPAELSVGVALGCNSAWVSMNFKSMNLFAGFQHGESLLDTTYLISIVAVALTLLLVGLFDTKTGPLIEKRAVKVIVPLGVAASTLLMPLAGSAGLLGDAVLVISGTASGIFSGLLLIYFGMAYCRMSTRSIVLGAALSVITSTFLFSLYLMFSPFEACVFAASMPCIAALLLHAGMDRISLPQREDFAPLSEQNMPTDVQERAELAHLTLCMAAASVLVGFANEAVRTLYIQMGISGIGGPSYALIQALVAFAVTVGAAIIALALVNRQGETMPKYCYRTLIVFLVFGALLVPVPFIYPEVNVYIPYGINAAAYQYFNLFMWTILVGICGRYSIVRLRTFSFVRAAWALGPLLGILLGRFVLNELGLSLQSVFPVALVAAFIVLLVSGIAFTETDLMKAMAIIPFERRRRFQEKCQQVIARYELSPREGEIMTMFAKGRNLAYIQEQLNLSKSTVSTHRQHIYQKLDIHSQQELLDVIQDIQ